MCFGYNSSEYKAKMNLSSYSGVLLALVALGVSVVSCKKDFQREDLQTFLNSFVETFSDKDAEGIAEFYATNGRRMAPNQNTQIGREAIKTYYTGLFMDGFEFVFTECRLGDVIVEEKDAALAEVFQTLEFSWGTLEYKGFVLFNRENGNLKILAQIYNRNP